MVSAVGAAAGASACVAGRQWRARWLSTRGACSGPHGCCLSSAAGLTLSTPTIRSGWPRTAEATRWWWLGTGRRAALYEHGPLQLHSVYLAVLTFGALLSVIVSLLLHYFCCNSLEQRLLRLSSNERSAASDAAQRSAEINLLVRLIGAISVSFRAGCAGHECDGSVLLAWLSGAGGAHCPTLPAHSRAGRAHGLHLHHSHLLAPELARRRLQQAARAAARLLAPGLAQAGLQAVHTRMQRFSGRSGHAPVHQRYRTSAAALPPLCLAPPRRASSARQWHPSFFAVVHHIAACALPLSCRSASPRRTAFFRSTHRSMAAKGCGASAWPTCG